MGELRGRGKGCLVVLGSPCSLARCFLCFLLCCVCLCCLRLSCLRLRLPRPSHGLRDPLPFLPRASSPLIGDRRRPVARSPGVTSSCSHLCFLARTNMQATGWGLSSWAPAVGRCGAAAHSAWRHTRPHQVSAIGGGSGLLRKWAWAVP